APDCSPETPCPDRPGKKIPDTVPTTLYPQPPLRGPRSEKIPDADTPSTVGRSFHEKGCVELPVVVLAWVWGGLFAVNMALKESSLSRYPGWAEYRRRSWWLLPPIL